MSAARFVVRFHEAVLFVSLPRVQMGATLCGRQLVLQLSPGQFWKLLLFVSNWHGRNRSNKKNVKQ